jgi:propanol-preferring alcohol dehydrogenase
MELISKGVLTPRVETGALKDFAKKLAELHEGKIKSRIALVPESVSAVTQ